LTITSSPTGTSFFLLYIPIVRNEHDIRGQPVGMMPQLSTGRRVAMLGGTPG